MPQSGEMSQLDHASRDCIFLRELFQGFIEREKFLVVVRSRLIGQFNPLAAAAMPLSLLPSSIIDQNSAHRFGSRGEEVAAIDELTLPSQETDICLMNQGGRLERVAWSFMGQLLRCQSAQFVVKQRKKLLGGVGISTLDGSQDVGYFTHRDTE
jgi:hypothetical protein